MDNADPSTTIDSPPRQRLGETTWFNALWFQISWFSCVLGRYDTLLLTLALLALHFVLVAEPGRELRQLLMVAAVGIAVDAGLSLAGAYHFAGGEILPLWFWCLWLAFATTLRRSLSFLASRLWLAALVGALVVPLNYALGQRLGAVEFGYGDTVTLVTLGAIWAILLPACYRLAALAYREDAS